MSETLTHSLVAFGTATLRFFRWTNRAVGLAKTVEFGAMAAVGQYERWARREDAMNVQLTKQHLNDPDICIRCDTCEETCLVHAVTHDDNNCVVKAEVCEKCMEHHTMPDRGDRQLARGIATLHDEEQFTWRELPPPDKTAPEATLAHAEALEDDVSELLHHAHRGNGGSPRPSPSASKSTINLYNRGIIPPGVDANGAPH
jgi:ferredoxin